MDPAAPYRMVTASSLFDGHDASINIFRRLLQKAGLEVIHIGHNRSVHQIVTTAVQEDANAVCISSYQGGHMEFFRYLHQCLVDKGAGDISIFGGGGGTILPSEIDLLQHDGITRLYHAEDGRKLGLRGIIQDAVKHTHPVLRDSAYYETLLAKIEAKSGLTDLEIAKAITLLERSDYLPRVRQSYLDLLKTPSNRKVPVVGLTGPGGAGKSSLVDELVNRFLLASPKGCIAILSCDPTKIKTGGALLGDRIRMNSIYDDRVYMRSLATRGSVQEVSQAITHALQLLQHLNAFDLIILETAGTGQGDSAIVKLADVSVYVMTPEYGASSQLEKIDMLDFADIVVLNKFDRMGAEDALEDVVHTYANARNERVTKENRPSFPVFGTIASNFNDPGVTTLFVHLAKQLQKIGLTPALDLHCIQTLTHPHTFTIIPPERSFYLGEIAQQIRAYKHETAEKSKLASHLYALQQVIADLKDPTQAIARDEKDLGTEDRDRINTYQQLTASYQQESLEYQVRDTAHKRALYTLSLSDTKIPRIATPSYHDWGDMLRFMRLENYPGHFPYTAGVFQLKSDIEDPRRQFAGEGPPQRTNKRFHYLCRNDKAKRLSTAFDSVTLYGEDPAARLDIYGKIGNSGVSIATLDDMKSLYEGFDLIDPLTSVSLTINGPAPIILAMFLNTAIDFEVAKCPDESYASVKKRVLEQVRGTVQADILKEEQAQNTCIFSSKFALKMMGDMEEYFISHHVRNFYSVSISGYHIAEAGANPITQLALTLANGFTYIEYYLARGMAIDAFAPHLSFFFSSGLDPEYSVIGRVARRIWALALKYRYGANERSCKLKYHIQTSGRSLHAQEIAFNDIRTTLQALLALYDACNSLHTNAYDEAITTPTEESVRRAMAIQMILTKEFGVNKCDNPMQGSFFYEELTDLVEEAVLTEFEALSRRGGVLGAMEKQYQRHRIQTESMKYEVQKASGELPLVGVNTFVSEAQPTDYEHIEVVRATDKEKQDQIQRVQAFIKRAGPKNQAALERLRTVALSGGNIFDELMETVKHASLGQITHVLYQCGGEYRRSM